MVRYVMKRILMLIPILLAVSFIVYFIIDLTPGDAVDAQYAELSAEEKDEIRDQMGLNDPVIVRYGRYIWGALHGDMGVSTTYHEDALKI